MNGDADRRERIKAALARYEVNGKAKRGKRKPSSCFLLIGTNHGGTGRAGKVNDCEGIGAICICRAFQIVGTSCFRIHGINAEIRIQAKEVTGYDRSRRGARERGPKKEG